MSDNDPKAVALHNCISPTTRVVYLLTCFLQDKSLLMMARLDDCSLNMNSPEERGLVTSILTAASKNCCLYLVLSCILLNVLEGHVEINK